MILKMIDAYMIADVKYYLFDDFVKLYNFDMPLKSIRHYVKPCLNEMITLHDAVYISEEYAVKVIKKYNLNGGLDLGKQPDFIKKS